MISLFGILLSGGDDIYNDPSDSSVSFSDAFIFFIIICFLFFLFYSDNKKK